MQIDYNHLQALELARGLIAVEEDEREAHVAQARRLDVRSRGMEPLFAPFDCLPDRCGKVASPDAWISVAGH